MNIQTSDLDQFALDVQNLPLDALVLHELNPRQSVTDAEIQTLAASLKEVGLLQNLMGIELADGRYGIVAGGRRLRALQALQVQGIDLSPIPVKLTRDATEAEKWAFCENTARANLHPADEIRAYRALSRRGSDFSAIARAFAVTEAHVKRRMKLAELPDQVIDALKSGEITLDLTTDFTLSNDKERILEVLAGILSGEYSNYQVRKLLTGGATRGDDRRAIFVGETDYVAAGGGVSKDLFSNEVFFQDETLLQTIFEKKLKDFTAALQETEGWKWVDASSESYISAHDLETKEGFTSVSPIPGKLSPEQEVEFADLKNKSYNGDVTEDEKERLVALRLIVEGEFTTDQKAVSGVRVYVTHRGAIGLIKGLVAKADRSDAANAGVIKAVCKAVASDDDDAGPSFSAKLMDELHAIRLGAIQTALLDHPQLLLDLLAFTLSMPGASYCKPLDISQGKPQNRPENDDGYTLAPALNHPGDDDRRFDQDPLESFTSFRAKGKKHRDNAIISSAARLVSKPYRSNPLFDAMIAESGADMRRIWKPTAEGFFNRVKGGYLDDLFLELLGLEKTDELFKNFICLKKKEKSALFEQLFTTDSVTRELYAVTPEQISAIDKWVPDAF